MCFHAIATGPAGFDAAVDRTSQLATIRCKHSSSMTTPRCTNA